MSSGLWWTIGVVVVIAIGFVIFTSESTTIKYNKGFIVFIIHDEAWVEKFVFF